MEKAKGFWFIKSCSCNYKDLIKYHDFRNRSIGWQPYFQPHKSRNIYDTIIQPVSHMIHFVLRLSKATYLLRNYISALKYFLQKAQPFPGKGQHDNTGYFRLPLILL